MGGYMVVNSYVSPAIAAFKLSTVEATPSMALKWPWAWTTSASAAVRNSRATFGIPSSSALRANARYFWLAWLSPANASLRFVLVLMVSPLIPSDRTSLSGLHIRDRNAPQTRDRHQVSGALCRRRAVWYGAAVGFP